MRVLLVLLCLAAPALAAPDAATIKKAAAHFKLGQEFYKSGQYDRAIAEYQAALDLTGEPALIFNIALAHDKANRPEDALAAFLRYLEKEPDGQVADEARSDVARLTPIVDKLRADHAADEARKADAVKQADAERARQLEIQQRAERDKTHRAELAGQVAAIDKHARVQRFEAYTVGGVGVVALVAGTLFGLKARSIAHELEGHEGGWSDAQLARDADGRSANKKAIVLDIVGAAALVAGGVLYVKSARNAKRAETLRVEARAARTGAALSLMLRF